MLEIILIGILILCIMYGLTRDLNKENNLSFFSIDHTNVVRGVAVVLIVISHIGDKSGLRYFTPLGGIGVSIFLICSGYGLYKSYIKNGLDRFFEKRIFKILIPYWIVAMVCYITHIIDRNIIDMVLGLSLIKVEGIFWYVQYIVICYIGFYIVFRYVNGRYQTPLLIGIAIGMVLCINSLLLGEQSVAFILGILFAKHHTKDIKYSNAIIIGSLFIVLGGVNLILKQLDFVRDSNYIILSINGILLKTSIAIGILYLVYPLLKVNLINIFKIAGKLSYEIYLVHLPLVFMLVGRYNIINIIIYTLISITGILILNKMSNLALKKLDIYIYKRSC